MIPANIQRQHMLSVIENIHAGLLEVPPKQYSTIYCLEQEGFHYPPKYIIRMANVHANCEELWNFYGGPECNSFCRLRGFRIVSHGGAPHYLCGPPPVALNR
jgi:hypothetical protein